MKFPHLADVDVDDDATETFSTWHGVFHQKILMLNFLMKRWILID